MFSEASCLTFLSNFISLLLISNIRFRNNKAGVPSVVIGSGFIVITQPFTMSSNSPSRPGVHFDTTTISTPFGSASESNHYYDFAYLKQRAHACATTVVETIYSVEPQILTLPLTRITEQERELLSNSPPSDRFHKRVDKLSLVIVYFLVLVTEAARGLIMPTAWPYFQSFGGTKRELGAFIAAHSFGRLLSTLPAGILADRYSMRSLICMACILQAGGHFLYISASSLFQLYFSRVLIGIGSATTFLSYTHLAKVIPPDQCLYHYGFISAVLFIGVSVLPVVGGFLSTIHSVDLPFVPFLFDGKTYGAFILALINLFAAHVVLKYYISPNISAANYSDLREVSISSLKTSSVMPGPKNYNSLSPVPPRILDMRAIATCFVINFLLRGSVAMLETVSVPLLQEEYSLSVSEASKYMSLMGVFGVLSYASIKFIPRGVSDRFLVNAGLFFVLLGLVPLSFLPISSSVPITVFVTFFSLAWSVGFPLAGTTIMSLITKLLKGGPVGSYLGMFSFVGGLAPLICGIPVSQLWNSFGSETVFLTVVGMSAIGFALIAINYQRLVPSTIF